jgi:triacylglycerol esterase/lipase EstA (alpha/beta hydrolase family)
MLARYQQFTSFILALCAFLAFCFFWPLEGWWASLAAAVVLLNYAFWIAVLMGLSALLNRQDPDPGASLRQWVQAWWHECISTWTVFVWRQPFRARSFADHVPAQASSQTSRSGVVFIHGFLCNRAFWSPYVKRLEAQGIPFIALNLEPVFGSIDDYPALIEQAVQTLTERTGRPVHLVCHSMGGLAARAWLQRFNGYARVGQVITIGTPHHGTALSRGTPFANTRQMERFSNWQQRLESLETPAQRARFVCWYGPCDNVVVPARTATLDGADNRRVPARGHVDMAFDPHVMRDTLALITKS